MPHQLDLVQYWFNSKAKTKELFVMRAVVCLMYSASTQTEKEALALERFHMYLYGKEFELLTDHKPLQVIFSPRSKACAHVEKWILRLQSYKYKVVYIPEPQNVVNCLSRLLNKSDDRALHEETEQYICLISEGSTPVAMTTSEIERASSEDSDLEQVRKCLVTGNWNNLSCKEFSSVKDELCSIGHLVLRGTRIVIPETLREKILIFFFSFLVLSIFDKKKRHGSFSL